MSVLVCPSPVWLFEGQQQTGVWLKRSWKDLSPRALLGKGPCFLSLNESERAALTFFSLCSVLWFISPAAPFLLSVQPGNKRPSWCRAGHEPGVDPDPYPTLSVTPGQIQGPTSVSGASAPVPQPLVCAEGPLRVGRAGQRRSGGRLYR